jgi:hypothetical protein
MDEADLRAVGVPLQGDVHRRQLATNNWTGAENVGNLTQRASNRDFASSSAAPSKVSNSQPSSGSCQLLSMSRPSASISRAYAEDDVQGCSADRCPIPSYELGSHSNRSRLRSFTSAPHSHRLKPPLQLAENRQVARYLHHTSPDGIHATTWLQPPP